jgi:uncharacterized protein YndB with AHSA1/START domain
VPSITVDRTPDGRRLVVSQHVDVPPARAWQVFVDTELWPQWGPSVTAVDTENRYIEAGTTGRVRLPGGVWIPFEVTTCENYRWTWRVAGVPATGHRVVPENHTCRVEFEIPPVAAPYAVVCWRALADIASLAERT